MTDSMTPSNARFFAWMAVAATVVAADQVTKWAIVEWIALYDSVTVNSFINLTHQRNTGAAFSFLAGAGGWQRWFFVALASIVSVVIVIWLWRLRSERNVLLGGGLSLVLGGAIGNLIDRIAHGYVTDFVQVWFGDWAYPSFNVADAGISVGAAMLIIDALFFSGRNEIAADSDPDSSS
jgi:signal peptidase II